MLEYAKPHHLKDYCEASDPPVSVGVRMQGFELVMRQCGLKDWRKDALCVLHPPDPIVECCSKLVAMRRRNKAGLFDWSVLRVDEDLAIPQSARIAVLSRRALYEDPLKIAHEASRQRSFFDPREPMLSGDDVVENLQYREGRLASFIEIWLQHLDKRCRGSFEGAGAQRFPPKRCVPEEGGIWKNLARRLIEPR